MSPEAAIGLRKAEARLEYPGFEVVGFLKASAVEDTRSVQLGFPRDAK